MTQEEVVMPWPWPPALGGGRVGTFRWAAWWVQDGTKIGTYCGGLGARPLTLRWARSAGGSWRLEGRAICP